MLVHTTTHTFFIRKMADGFQSCGFQSYPNT